MTDVEIRLEAARAHLPAPPEITTELVQAVRGSVRSLPAAAGRSR